MAGVKILLAIGMALETASLGACGGAIAPGPGGEGDASNADASGASVDAGADASRPSAIGAATAPDCPGCTFPPPAAEACASVPSIKITYPPDTALLPPNLGALSVQWVPFGAPFTRFEVDFEQSSQAPATDWRIVTSCSTQTTDAQGAASGGCELDVDRASWARLAAANRGGAPIAITVRGTSDGACASTSEDTVHVSLAEDDVLGKYVYWKSYIAPLGLSGRIWAKTFGDPDAPEEDLTSALPQAPLCAGCHAVARDGSRVLAYPADDTDPDYSGLAGTYVDLSAWPSGPAAVLATGQPPGWTAIASSSTTYVTSNGLPCTPSATGATCSESDSASYPAAVPVDGFSLWDARSGAFTRAVSLGPSGSRPSMPAWSVDGASLVFVEPAATGSWDNALRNDDDHLFGGSLYQAPYAGGGAFGPPTVLVASQGENNYYPTYSPDAAASFVLFDRARLDTGVATLTGCLGTPPKAACPNDSFSNPAARLMIVAGDASASPVDLEKANGSAAAIGAPLSNSFPRFAPFVQTYEGRRLFWITFSSTRDYGLRVLNHKDGMYPCYPADSLEWPGSVHRNLVDPLCQHPQLWMAPIVVGADRTAQEDPSGVAFWIPYQDPTADNHMATWTWAPGPGGEGDGGAVSCSCSPSGGPCGPAGGCGCCAGEGLVCSGDGRCIPSTP